MIDTKTRLFGVIGNPVAHSLGPVMHNAALKVMDFPAIYLAFNVTDLSGAMDGVRALGIRGLSVTIPHKIPVMEHLDTIDSLAEQIGAVNTILNNKGNLTGFNTDCHGAVAALKRETDLTGKCVAVLGAGGAARAVGFGLSTEGAELIIYNRNTERGETLAACLKAEYHPWKEIGDLHADVVINTTPVGMVPEVDNSPLPDRVLKDHMVVMDIVYTPLETKLLKTARNLGCRVVDGLTMFVLQGARQLELWTGRKAPVDTMRNAVLEALK